MLLKVGTQVSNAPKTTLTKFHQHLSCGSQVLKGWHSKRRLTIRSRLCYRPHREITRCGQKSRLSYLKWRERRWVRQSLEVHWCRKRPADDSAWPRLGCWSAESDPKPGPWDYRMRRKRTSWQSSAPRWGPAERMWQMDEWMEWMIKWNEWMNKWMSEWMNEKIWTASSGASGTPNRHLVS